MKETLAVRFHQTGGTEVLKIEKLNVPSPGKGEVLIQNYAVGLNFIDTYYRTGLYQTELPSGLGFEGAGEVLEVGEDVTEFKVGDRVAYPHSPIGAYSKYRTLASHWLVKLPSSISYEEGAAMMLKGLTVQYLFRQTYDLKQGDTILFHAAAGGVGLIACQWARHLGVNLIGTVSSEEKGKLALEMGATHFINYTTEDVKQRVLELTHNQKVKVVYDSVGKSTWETSLDCLAPRGLMVSFGNASGAVTGVNLGILAQKGSLYVTRPILATHISTREKLVAASNELFDLVSRGIIKIQIGQKFPLEQIQEAHKELESRRTKGSTILIP
ncbi:quinone oxidoreductase family protein [Peredibacter starrii]|uniref:Quinone oxidoreductase n=1 Tax=Peredibacter starrii TaxID=28202 RepID=A0AAX4HMM3_9BACT|nr:quinone oxidoreductase [Peredibacter starrii]WPU64134.1 quinone oxidoreductase [Peredibacter starrii]